MKILINNFIKIFVIFIFSLNINAIELISGKVQGETNWETLTKTDRDAGYFPSAVVDTGVNGIVYVYDGSIGKTNYIDGAFLGNWVITPWSLLTVMTGETPSALEDLYAAGVYEKTYKSQYWKVVNPSDIKTGDNVVWKNRYFTIDTYNKYGCLTQHPLRIGNIDSGDEALFLLIDNIIYVFSTTTNKILFSFNWVNSDEVKSATLLDIKDSVSDHRLHAAYQFLSGDAPQFVASSSEDKHVDDIYPAWRSFSKIYINDFTGDKNSDILLWRKLYKSRINSDEVKGFVKTGELLIHYAFVDSNYVLQQTDQVLIRAWLSNNQLTWQKGYPSKSECIGQEGMVIPEMHDTLLNDPDVLN